MSEYMGVIFMEEKISSGRLHRLVLSDRHTGSVTGVNDVVSFDENEIVLDTDMGLFDCQGKGTSCKAAYTGKGGAGSGRTGGQFELQFQCSTETVGRLIS